jgi:hypothetical protein
MITALDFRKITLVMTVGLCDAIDAGAISIHEAEHYLFSPHMMKSLADIDPELVDIVHKAAEFDDIRRLLSPDRLGVTVAAVRKMALDLLRKLPECDFQRDHWFGKLFPIVDD